MSNSNNEIYTTTVRLNSEEAKNRLQELEKEVKRLHSDMSKALEEGKPKAAKELEKQLKKAREELRLFRTETMNVNEVLDNISSASIDQLSKAAKVLQKQMRVLATDTQEFADKQAQLKAVKQRLQEIRVEGQAQEPWLNRMADGFNKIQGLAISAMAAITGLSMSIRKSTGDYAQMEEAMANSRKYTGQTSEEVHDLNEELKKMDTRTSREQLNALAGDAGRLGFETEKLILDFVEAADIINVSLGDDLGEGAVKNIGKLTELFEGKDNLKENMIATASAVNELSASSSADAGYLVEFEARLAGTGKQARLAQTEIMGYASVLDQNMQQVETSSTALSQLITKMFQEPEKFAKLAGQQVSEFTELLKTDANQALLKFFEAMRSRGGFDSLAPMFDEMGLSGTRCVGVFSVLADKLDDVVEAQSIAKDAFENGTSVMDEYNIQNSTVQAGLDKNINKFHELSVELGEKLMPVVEYTVSGGSLLIKMLSVLIDFCFKYRTALATLATAIVAYNVYINASNLLFKAQYYWLVTTQAAHKAWLAVVGTYKVVLLAANLAMATFTGNTQRAAVAQRALNIAMASNPYLIVASALAVLVAGLIDFNKETAEAVKEESAIEKANKRAGEEYDKQSGRVQYLTSVLHDNTAALGIRKSALEELRKIVPGYLGELTDEGRLINDNTSAIEDYIKALEKQIKLKAYQEDLETLYKKKAEAERYRNRARKTLEQEREEDRKIQDVPNFEGAGTRAAKGVLDMYEQQLKKIDEEIKEITGEIKNLPDVESIVSGSGGGGGTPGTKTDSKEDSKLAKQLRERADAAKALAREEVAMATEEYSRGEINYTEYLNKCEAALQKSVETRKGIYAGDEEEQKRLYAEGVQIAEQYGKKRTQSSLKEIEKERRARQRELESNFATEGSLIYKDTLALNEALFRSDVLAMEQRMSLYAAGSDEYLDLAEEKERLIEEHKIDLQVEYMKRLSEYREAFQLSDYKKEEDIELRYLNDMHAKGLVSEEEYQKMILGIKQDYASRRVTPNAQRMTDADVAFNLANNAVSKSIVEQDYGSGGLIGGLGGIADEVEKAREFFDELERLQQQGVITHQQMEDAKVKYTSQAYKKMVSYAQSAMSQVSSIMSAYSSYTTACYELEATQVEKRYDREIKAAGENEEMAKHLEEQKQKELAKIKRKEINEKEQIDVAQVWINTALSIAKGFADYGPIAGAALTALSTAMAALQVSTIEKQAQAQKAALQYYEGGFTGGNQYRREAGVVHEGEFVANHNAVNNPEIRPVLELLDWAQRNNSVGSLTASDISHSIGASQQQVVAPVVNVQNDNSELQRGFDGVEKAVNSLNRVLSSGIRAYSVISGPDGSYERTRQYEKLIKNKDV